MTRTRTAAACLESALADLPRVSRPVDVTDAEAFPNISEASRHYAAMSAERKAELNKEWNDD